MLTSARPSLMKIMRITGLDRAFPELHPSAARGLSVSYLAIILAR